MKRQEIINTLKANTTTNKNGAFTIALYKKNFYNKKTFIDFITTANSYAQAQEITNKLNNQFTNELKENNCKVVFATTQLFATAYSYKFAKQ